VARPSIEAERNAACAVLDAGERDQTPPLSIERFDEAAAWAGLDPKDQAAIGAAALGLVAAEHVYDCASGLGLDPRLIRIADAAMQAADTALQEAFGAAIDKGELVTAEGLPKIPAVLGDVCRYCACSQNDACPGGCGWAKPDVCTECVGREPARG
jgi:hypothetical protein